MNLRSRLLEIVDRFADSDVVLYGDLVLDRFILGTPKRISREAPVIILRHEGQRDVPGGGANALANIAALGARVTAVAAVGDDESGAALRAALEGHGVDTGRIVTVHGYRTPTKVRILGGGESSLKHQVARYDIEDTLALHGVWREELRRHLHAAMRTAGAVAISDYGYGCVDPEVVADLRNVRGDDSWMCLDSRYRIGDFRGISGATPNLQELEEHVGKALRTDGEIAEAASNLRRELGAQFLLTTRGNHGMTLVAEDREPFHIAVFGTDEVADVTGAGDTVLAVLATSLAAGAPVLEAAVIANIAAGLVVMKLGTATVSSDELREAISVAVGERDDAS